MSRLRTWSTRLTPALALLLALPLSAQAGEGAGSGEAAADFRSLLAESELVFTRPSGYVELPPGRTPVLDYEKAVRSADGAIEIRMAVRPLKRVRIDYDDPHGAVPDPNHIFPLVFESLASRLAGGRHAPSNAYPPEQAAARFNADWAAAAVFDTIEDFDTGFSQGLLIAIHRNQVADAYTVLLFDDYHAVKERLNRVLDALKFTAAKVTPSARPASG